MTDAIKDDQEPFNSIGLIPLKSFYGSEIKLNGGIRKNAWSLSDKFCNQGKRRKTGKLAVIYSLDLFLLLNVVHYRMARRVKFLPILGHKILPFF